MPSCLDGGGVRWVVHTVGRPERRRAREVSFRSELRYSGRLMDYIKLREGFAMRAKELE